MPTMNDSRCDQCAYFSDLDGEEGECRRFPPAVTPHEDGGTMNSFPLVVPDLWCGEFQRRVN